MSAENPEERPEGRTVRIRGNVVRNLRLRKAWSIKRLANKAGCSEKTIKSIEKSSKIYVMTLSKIANALDVEPHVLIDDSSEADDEGIQEQPPLHPVRSDLTLQGIFESFDETTGAIQIEQKLKELIGAKYKIIVLAILNGSVLIQIAIDTVDALTMVHKFYKGDLDEIGVLEIDIQLYIHIKGKYKFYGDERLVNNDSSRFSDQDIEFLNKGHHSNNGIDIYYDTVNYMYDPSENLQPVSVQILNYSKSILSIARNTKSSEVIASLNRERLILSFKRTTPLKQFITLAIQPQNRSLLSYVVGYARKFFALFSK